MCEEILDSLDRNDERGLDRAQADLQDALYEMNREVRLQYDDGEDDDFFGSIKRTFLGDDDDDLSYPSRSSGYRDDARSGYRDDYRSDYRDNSRSVGYNNYYDERENYRPRYRNSSSEPSRRSGRSRYQNRPYENDWDEDDDDWF
ncbi:MAG: hypothetical protein F6K10_42800 [Moorea sp. SIO2B7]|nr:hypothetical protein [Moorena sp. SIO2B7]